MCAVVCACVVCVHGGGGGCGVCVYVCTWSGRYDMIVVFLMKVPASMQKQTPKIQRLHMLVPTGTLLLQTFCFSIKQNW